MSDERSGAGSQASGGGQTEEVGAMATGIDGASDDNLSAIDRLVSRIFGDTIVLVTLALAAAGATLVTRNPLFIRMFFVSAILYIIIRVIHHIHKK